MIVLKQKLSRIKQDTWSFTATSIAPLFSDWIEFTRYDIVVSRDLVDTRKFYTFLYSSFVYVLLILVQCVMAVDLFVSLCWCEIRYQIELSWRL